jgi:hypothetical protein
VNFLSCGGKFCAVIEADGAGAEDGDFHGEAIRGRRLRCQCDLRLGAAVLPRGVAGS